MSGGYRYRNQMSAIAYLWTIELENNGTGWFRKKNESPCYASLGISKRRAWALPRSTRGTRVPNCSIRWGLATMSQSSCLTAPRAKSMHSRCIAPVSARTRVRADTGVGHFPNVAKIGEYAKHFRIDFRFAIGLRINLARLRTLPVCSPIPPNRTSSSCRFPSWERQLKAASLRGTSRPELCRR